MMGSRCAFPQLADYNLERQVWFLRPLIECCQIFRILRQAQPHRVIDNLGNRLVGLGSRNAQSPMKLGIEINAYLFRELLMRAS
jgi:hypothetical protein